MKRCNIYLIINILAYYTLIVSTVINIDYIFFICIKKHEILEFKKN